VGTEETDGPKRCIHQHAHQRCGSDGFQASLAAWPKRVPVPNSIHGFNLCRDRTHKENQTLLNSGKRRVEPRNIDKGILHTAQGVPRCHQSQAIVALARRTRCKTRRHAQLRASRHDQEWRRRFQRLTSCRCLLEASEGQVFGRGHG
jgi:hypothetical protein